MKNTLLEFDNLKTQNIVYEDYTSRDYSDIYNTIWENYEYYLMDYILSDNELFELTSLKLYDTEQYWDVVNFVNNYSPVFDWVYDEELVNSFAEDKVNKYVERFDTSGNYSGTYDPATSTLSQTRYDEMIAEEIAKLIQDNEDRRLIKVVRPSRMEEFLKLLRV